MTKPAFLYSRKDSGIELDDSYEKTSFLTLPAEIRTHIWELVFDPEESHQTAFSCPKCPEAPEILQEDYWASSYLQPLLTCRQFYQEAHLLAFSRTTFAIRNPYTVLDIAGRMQTTLRPSQIASLRSIAIISEARHFRQMHHWKDCAFGIPALDLDEMVIVLHSSSYWHYLFDFNATMTRMLRDFNGTKKIRFVRNRARVKPHFHTWFNRFVGAMLRLDRVERFGKKELRVEKTWWVWEFDAKKQTAELTRAPVKNARLDVEEYDVVMAPMMEWLKNSMEMEEYDPDPMSRLGFV